MNLNMSFLVYVCGIFDLEVNVTNLGDKKIYTISTLRTFSNTSQSREIAM